MTPENTPLYKIWERWYGVSYDLIVYYDEGHSVSFGTGKFSSDKTVCFKDKNHNYLKALYYLTYYGAEKISSKEQSALRDLMAKQPRPDLKSTDAWSEVRMRVLPYLNDKYKLK